jgi:hypothetical protein
MLSYWISLFIFYLSLASPDAPSNQVREKVVTVLSSHTDLNSARDEEISFQLPAAAKAMPPNELYDRGEALLMRGLPSDASPYLARAAELMPDDSFAQGNFAIALHQARIVSYFGRHIVCLHFRYHADRPYLHGY